MIRHKGVLVVTGCFALIASSATAIMQLARPATEPPYNNSISASMRIVPAYTLRYSVCALVEIVSAPKKTELSITTTRNELKKVAFNKVRVRVVDGYGAEVGAKLDAYLPDVNMSILEGKKSKHLLLGWRSSGKTMNLCWPDGFVDDDGKKMGTIEVEHDALFAGCLVPTKLESLSLAGSWQARAYTAIALTIQKGADPATLRRLTDDLAYMDATYGPLGIDGQSAHTWLMRNLADILGKASQTTSLEKLRIGGLLADYRRPNGTMAYVKKLPGLFSALSKDPAGYAYQDRSRDIEFTKKINLGYMVNADEFVEFCLDNPSIRYLAIRGVYDMPSLDVQKKLLSILDGPDLYDRSFIYSKLANWYGMNDWVLNCYVCSPKGQSGEMIPKEKEMYDYWHQKIGDPIKP